MARNIRVTCPHCGSQTWIRELHNDPCEKCRKIIVNAQGHLAGCAVGKRSTSGSRSSNKTALKVVEQSGNR